MTDHATGTGNEYEQLSDYTDWYLNVDNPENSIVYPGGAQVSGKTAIWAVDLIEECSKNEEEDFAIEYNGIFYRGYRMAAREGEIVKLRIIPRESRELDDVGLHPNILKHLRDGNIMKSGLFLVIGSAGNGKSTTCAALVKDRLRRDGGVCIAIEDPPEFYLEGSWGEGRCYQNEVKEGGFARAVRGAMRAYPVGVRNIMLIGEIRDSDTAGEALNAALSGCLVIATIHGSSVIEGLQRLESLAAGRVPIEEARLKLASAFRGCIHQRLMQGRVVVEPLFGTQQVYALLGAGEIRMLGTEKQKQAQILRNGGTIQVRND